MARIHQNILEELIDYMELTIKSITDIVVICKLCAAFLRVSKFHARTCNTHTRTCTIFPIKLVFKHLLAC